MIAFLSLFNENQNFVKKEEIRFIHVPDDLDEESIRISCSKAALDFARKLDVSKVYLNYGKEKFIEYEFKI